MLLDVVKCQQLQYLCLVSLGTFDWLIPVFSSWHLKIYAIHIWTLQFCAIPVKNVVKEMDIFVKDKKILISTFFTDANGFHFFSFCLNKIIIYTNPFSNLLQRPFKHEKTYRNCTGTWEMRIPSESRKRYEHFLRIYFHPTTGWEKSASGKWLLQFWRHFCWNGTTISNSKNQKKISENWDSQI